ncbi:MAG: MFS transporter [Helicobacteraceae bacterium]
MKASFWLSFIMFFRFLGLFLVMPLISIYAMGLTHNGLLVGLGVSGYALTQIFFLYFLGKLSDKIGRKKVIAGGLLVFALGSLIAGLAPNIYILIIGRFLQGAGAISSTVTAFISDLVPEDKRSRAMAFFGMFIGLSFIASLILGPALGAKLGVPSLFLISAFLALLAIGVLVFLVPPQPKILHHKEDAPNLRAILAQTNLLKMNVFMFFHSAVMTTAFFIIPVIFTERFHYARSELAFIFVPAMALGIISMGAAIYFGEKKGGVKPVFIFGILLIIAGFSLSKLLLDLGAFLVSVVLIFAGITSVEPLLQSSATKFTKARSKGAALGVFSSFQYAGILSGGVASGILIKTAGLESLISAVLLLSVLWLAFSFFIENPPKIKTFLAKNLSPQITALKGFVEFYQSPSSGDFVIKIDTRKTREEDVQRLINV